MRCSLLRLVCVFVTVVFFTQQSHAGVIFTQDVVKFGPPVLKLDHALNCFTLVDGTEICDKNSVLFSYSWVSSNGPAPLPPPLGSNGELVLIDGSFEPFPISPDFPTYFLGNRLSGRYNVSFTETSEFGPYDSALFLIASAIGPVISRGPGKAHFDAIQGQNYFLSIGGYSRTQQTFNLTIVPSEVGEMPTLAAFFLGLSLLCWTCKQRRASHVIGIARKSTKSRFIFRAWVM